LSDAAVGANLILRGTVPAMKPCASSRVIFVIASARC